MLAGPAYRGDVDNIVDRQEELLEKEDGRYYAIDKVGTGLGSIATTEWLKKRCVSFGLPSGPALFLHLAYRAYSKIKSIDPLSLFEQHPQGNWPDNQTALFDLLEELISHVVFSFTALEAFANEVIPDDFTYTFTVERTGEERTYGKDDIERRISLDEKLGIVLPQIFALKSPKGGSLWGNYKTIKKVRDGVVHLKSVDKRSSGPEAETIWGTLLRMHSEPFCNHAHAMIGYFKPAIQKRRYFAKYPYGAP
jgi:hypothetical protein